MMMVVIFLALLLQVTQPAVRHACVPNSQFVLDGKMCSCDKNGWWSEPNCFSIGRRTCLPGQIIWQGCNQCICQESGKLLCNNADCSEENEDETTVSPFMRTAETSTTWCTPYKSYYINCSICFCPASGRTAEAHCATDKSCQKPLSSSAGFVVSSDKNVCIPRVMYLFPCLHCLCSDEGVFTPDKCVETCFQSQEIETARRCISRTFYRRICNICWCPDNSIPDDTLCTKSVCSKHSKFQPLKVLRTTSKENCHPHSFIGPKCFYCACDPDGNVNENACLEQTCLKLTNFKYDVSKKTCSPGEMVPNCVECFCLRNRTSIKTYCSSSCSYKGKLGVLERVLKDSYTNRELIDVHQIKSVSDNDVCEPNTTYLDQGRYCLCPENGNTNFKLCTSIGEDFQPLQISKSVVSNKVPIHPNQPCIPNTFVEIDCNTCYCSKSGTIDPKWCTYDDCNAKKTIQDSHKIVHVTTIASNTVDDTCIPGSISKEDCNFCICPENGYLQNRACTKNKCSEVDLNVSEDRLTCEPLAYYLVDCNVCLCPRDGIKNVEKCTKKICEKTFLRSVNCIPGQFFSDDCNVCVCPPNGNKADKVCTNHQCSDAETTWKKIFSLSNSVLESSIPHTEIVKNDVEVCFSGEQFEIGCKICVCSDVGLRSFAECIDAGCDEDKNRIEKNHENESTSEELTVTNRRSGGESCISVNLTDCREKIECTPGATYVLRCRQCICPHMGAINIFCRPLPRGFYCEEALPIGRRENDENTTNYNTTAENSSTNAPETTIAVPALQPVKYQLTLYNCTKPGKVLDKCFICECEAEKLVVIEEHCYQSDDNACNNILPTFLDRTNKIAIGYYGCCLILCTCYLTFELLFLKINNKEFLARHGNGIRVVRFLDDCITITPPKPV